MLNRGIELLLLAEKKNYVRAMFILAFLHYYKIGKIPDSCIEKLYLKIINNCTKTELLYVENNNFIEKFKQD